jgi:hypothetical protein
MNASSHSKDREWRAPEGDGMRTRHNNVRGITITAHEKEINGSR